MNSAVNSETQQYPLQNRSRHVGRRVSGPFTPTTIQANYATILVVCLRDHHISSAYCHVGQSSSSSAENNPVVLCVIVLIRKTTCLVLFVEHLLLVLVITCRRCRHQGNAFTSQAHHGTRLRHPIVPIGTIVGCLHDQQGLRIGHRDGHGRTFVDRTELRRHRLYAQNIQESRGSRTIGQCGIGNIDVRWVGSYCIERCRRYTWDRIGSLADAQCREITTSGRGGGGTTTFAAIANERIGKS